MTATFRPAMTLWLEAGNGSHCRCCPAVADYVVNDARTGGRTRTPVCRKHLSGALREPAEATA